MLRDLDEQTARELGWPGRPRTEAEMLSTPRDIPPVERNGSLPFAPLAVALESEPDEPNWLLEGYLAPRTLNLLAGRPKVGKSTLTFALTEALSAGRPFLDRSTRETGVLYLSEESKGTLREKARRFGLVPEANGRVHLLTRKDARSKTWTEIVEEAVDYALANKLGVLIVDVWDKWAELAGDSENSAGAVLEALRPLEQAVARGLTVFIVAHQRKADGKYGEAVRGSNALIGAVDVVLELDRPPGNVDPAARVLLAQSRFGSTPEELHLVLGEEGYAISTGSELRVRAEIEQLHQAAAELAADGNETPTTKELADRVDISQSTVRDRLKGAPEFEQSASGRKNDPHRWKLSTGASPLAVESKKGEA